MYELSIIDLKIDPNQPRKSTDHQALEELSGSSARKLKRTGVDMLGGRLALVLLIPGLDIFYRTSIKHRISPQSQFI